MLTRCKNEQTEQDAVLPPGGQRDAAVYFGTYRSLQRYRTVFTANVSDSNDTGSVPANLCRQAAQAIQRGHGEAMRRPELATR